MSGIHSSIDSQYAMKMATERVNYCESIDPDHQRWARKYPHFPGVAECVRLIQNRKAIGTWADIISFELAHHARDTLPELIDAFKANANPVRLHVMIALEEALLPESVPFLIDVLRESDPECVPYAQRALQKLNTRESRRAIWDASQRHPRPAE